MNEIRPRFSSVHSETGVDQISPHDDARRDREFDADEAAQV